MGSRSSRHDKSEVEERRGGPREPLWHGKNCAEDDGIGLGWTELPWMDRCGQGLEVSRCRDGVRV